MSRIRCRRVRSLAARTRVVVCAGLRWVLRYRRHLLVSAAVLIALAAAGDRWVAHRGGSQVFTATAELPPRRAALVLGTAREAWGRPNRYYRLRLAATRELWAAGRISWVIVSGDHGRPDYDEPGAMKADLIALGVPADVIVVDHAGFRTLDSVLRCRDVFGVDDPIIVSQRFHLERALYLAAARGLDAVGYAAASPTGVLTWRVRAREVLSRCAAVLEGTILPTRARYPGPPEPLE